MQPGFTSVPSFWPKVLGGMRIGRWKVHRALQSLYVIVRPCWHADKLRWCWAACHTSAWAQWRFRFTRKVRYSEKKSVEVVRDKSSKGAKFIDAQEKPIHVKGARIAATKIVWTFHQSCNDIAFDFHGQSLKAAGFFWLLRMLKCLWRAAWCNVCYHM